LMKLLVRPFFASRRKRAARQSRQATPESRRLFLKKAAIGIGAYTFLGAMYSIYNRDEYKIENVSLRLKNLPSELEGIRIVMISDVHSGLYMTEEDMSRYNEEVNKLNPDLIFIPGDFVTLKTDEIIPFVKSFSGLKSKFGTFACLGNHDFFANPNVITEKLRENGISVLRNETQELDIKNARLMLSGVDDGGHANFKKVAYEANSLDTARILLCHKPYYFDTAVAGGYDAMVSGHTHGGQIVLANLLGFKLTPATFVSPYVSGKYHRGDSVMYVSRGVGTVGLPVRLNCPPEITVFTLGKKS
ncbi:MAG: metallophosphoesterase, partial [Bacteroidetes bacterium]|nr:metallophosphoesterase [Bacteroidota bacterium]